MIVLKRYCHNNGNMSRIGLYTSWRDAIADLSELEYQAEQEGFQVQHVSDTKFNAYNSRIRFTYYIIPEE